MLGFLAACQSAEPLRTAPQTTHMLRLSCEGETSGFYMSRLAVLDIGDPFHDYGIGTGHGIPPGRPCEVADFEGRSAIVEHYDFAPDYASGTSSDWAILRFRRLATPELVRYPLEALQPATPEDGTEIQFAQARGLAENRQTCQIETLVFPGGQNRISHDCRNRAGQSGTPITQRIDGVDRLVGLHIGELWMVESPKTGRPDRKGYLNLFDDVTIAQIEAIIAQNK